MNWQKSCGHQVIRLPPCHCHFNPIEMIWAQVKGYVAREHKHFGEVQRLLREAVDTVTPENWASVVRHTKDIMQVWENKSRIEESVEQLISIGSESSSDVSSENGSDSDMSRVFPLSETI